MPYPVVHSYAGYSLYKVSKGKDEKWSWLLTCLFILTANLADFDFLPGILIHQPQLFHRGVSHSLGAALICGLIAGSAIALWKKRSFVKSFCVASAVYFSHVVLDYFWGHGPDAAMPIFWPLSSAKFISPLHHFRPWLLKL